MKIKYLHTGRTVKLAQWCSFLVLPSFEQLQSSWMGGIMKEYVTDYQNFVCQKQAEYNDSVKTLKADAREDEANLYKVRANICDVFYKMIAATEKKVAAMKITDEEENNRIYVKEYLNWFDVIPENWRINLALANKHDNLIVAKTEEVKLDTALILRHKFLELAERRSTDND